MALHKVLECTQNYTRCFLPDMEDSFKFCVLSGMGFNFSLSEASKILHEHRTHDHNVNHTTEVVLIFVYASLMISGLLANLVISFVVARKAQMHTPRNLYIVNLTISDMTLCVVCMPFTLVNIIQRHWDLGEVLCKLVPALQGANITVSVGTITVIALDRYFTIVRGQQKTVSRRNVVMSIIILWAVSALATSPLFYYQVLVPVNFQNMVLYDMCLENWPSEELKISYTVGMMLAQSVIPAVVVGTVHIRIATHLDRRVRARNYQDERRVHRELERNRQTTLRLSLMTILFALSWLPLSLFSLTADLLLSPEILEKQQVSPQVLYVVFAVCHVIAMSSAISNPIVYGWLNSNIRKEFLQLIQSKCASPTEEVRLEDAPEVPAPDLIKVSAGSTVPQITIAAQPQTTTDSGSTTVVIVQEETLAVVHQKKPSRNTNNTLETYI